MSQRCFRYDLLVQQILWNVAAVLGNLPQDSLMEPGVHPGGVGHHVRGGAQFFRQFSAGLAAVVEVKQEEQV